jgi:hypothetical protein
VAPELALLTLSPVPLPADAAPDNALEDEPVAVAVEAIDVAVTAA